MDCRTNAKPKMIKLLEENVRELGLGKDIYDKSKVHKRKF